MSASAATGSNDTICAIWLAFTTQIEFSAEMPRSCAMYGSARLVIELLNTAIESPMVTVAIAITRGRPGGMPSYGVSTFVVSVTLLESGISTGDASLGYGHMIAAD